MDNRPIGIFDSGIGGLTVVKEIINVLPNENIVYLGDTARIPYGTRSKETITQFALELVKFLLQENPKILVVACNSISANSLDAIQEYSSAPVIGVIEPAVKEAVKTTKTGKIGIIGTRATIESKIYEKEIHLLHNHIGLIQKSCPLFVSFAEEGWLDHPALKIVADEYLSGFKKTSTDTLILGCTHYPLLSGAIRDSVGEKVKLIDPAKPTARELKNILEKQHMLRKNGEPVYKFFVTDEPELAEKTANIFFGNKFPGKLEKVVL